MSFVCIWMKYCRKPVLVKDLYMDRNQPWAPPGRKPWFPLPVNAISCAKATLITADKYIFHLYYMYWMRSLKTWKVHHVNGRKIIISSSSAWLYLGGRKKEQTGVPSITKHFSCSENWDFRITTHFAVTWPNRATNVTGNSASVSAVPPDDNSLSLIDCITLMMVGVV